VPQRLQKNVRNRILTALPEDEFKLLTEKLHYVELALGESLHRAGEPIENVFFVESGFISVLTMLSDGAPLEIGLIGAEGVAGVSVILGATNSYSETMCQTGGGAFRIGVAALKDIVAQAPHLRDLLLRYTHVFHVQVAQTAACNAHHELGQRLARWLLAAHDRSGVPELSLTQDLIAVMLGVRRAAFDCQHRGKHAAKSRRYSLPPRAHHHPRSHRPRGCGLRMLRSRGERIPRPFRRTPVRKASRRRALRLKPTVDRGNESVGAQTLCGKRRFVPLGRREQL